MTRITVDPVFGAVKSNEKKVESNEFETEYELVHMHVMT
jgi:hypothetical protein